MSGNLHSVTYDAADIRTLATFYVQLAGFKETFTGKDWITLESPDGHRLSFQQAADHVPPQWPDPRFPQQYHLDFLVPDLSAAVDTALSLGASKLPGGGDTFTVLADPSGHPFCLCRNDGADSVKLADFAIDVPDGKAIAPFYADLLGLEVTYEGPEGAMVSADGKLSLMFQNVAEYHAPRWPDPAHPQQAHIDVDVTDIEAAQARVLELGATKLPGGGGTDSGYLVYADPAGHPFCLVWGQ